MRPDIPEMAATALIPPSAPFGDDDRDHLDRVLSTASPTQRAWLAGFLAGLDAGRGQEAVPDAPARAAEPLTILFASESGNAERLAHDTAKLARKNGFKPKIVDFADLDLADSQRADASSSSPRPGAKASRPAAPHTAMPRCWATARRASTASTSPCSRSAIPPMRSSAPSARPSTRGSRNSAQARRRARRLRSRLRGAGRGLDQGHPRNAGAAARDAGNVVAVDFAPRAAAEVSREAVAAEVAEHIDLNSSRSEKETIHLELGFEGARAGLQAGQFPRTLSRERSGLVDAVLAARACLRGRRAPRADYEPRHHDDFAQDGRDVRRDDRRPVREGASSTTGAAKTWIEGRQLIDLVETFPVALSAEQLRALTRPLPPRAYSIASSRKEVGDEAHLLVSAVRYETHGRARHGVASTFVADRAKEGRRAARQGEAEQAFRACPVRPRHHHGRAGHGRRAVPRLRAGAPRDRRDRPQLAVLRRPQLHARFPLPARMAGRAQGRLAGPHGSRLLARHAREGLRAAPLWERRRDLVDWLENGALFYVCGDAKAMAKDVRATLVARLCRREGAGAGAPRNRRRAARARASAISRTSTESASAAMSKRPLAQRTHQGGERLPARHARRRPARDVTGAIAEDDQQLVKFHGMYLQDDRDLRPERTKKKIEKAFAFMIRAAHSRRRAHAGAVARARRDRAHLRATGRCGSRRGRRSSSTASSSRTSRRRMKAIDAALLDTIAACGDVNRNVMCNRRTRTSRRRIAPRYELATAHLRASPAAHAAPIARSGSTARRSPAARRRRSSRSTARPICRASSRSSSPCRRRTTSTCSPRISASSPSSMRRATIEGWNVTVGGGMGMTHGETDTYPRTADVMGFCAPKDALAVAEAVVTVQRDWGDRTNRKHARLKYTIEDRGLDAFRAEVEKRSGKALEPARPFAFTSNGDRYGWTEGEDGRCHLTLFIENGRVRDMPGGPRCSPACAASPRCTTASSASPPNQNVIIANIAPEDRAAIEALVARARADEPGRRAAAQRDGLRRAADLRPRARRERALSAEPRHGARGAARARMGSRKTTSRSA